MLIIFSVIFLVLVTPSTLGQVTPTAIPPGQVLQIDGITSEGKVIYSLIPLTTYQQQWIQQGRRQLYPGYPLGLVQPTGILSLADGGKLPQGSFLVADGLDSGGNVVYRVITVPTYQLSQSLCPDRAQFAICGCQRPKTNFGGPKLIYIPPAFNGADYILLLVQTTQGTSRPDPICWPIQPPPYGPLPGPAGPCSILIPSPCGPILVPGHPSVPIQPGTVIIPGLPGIIVVPPNGVIQHPNQPWLPVQPGGIIIPSEPCTVQIPGLPGYSVQPGSIIISSQFNRDSWPLQGQGRLVIPGQDGQPAMFVYPGDNFSPDFHSSGVFAIPTPSRYSNPLIYPGFVDNINGNGDILSQYLTPPTIPGLPSYPGTFPIVPTTNSYPGLTIPPIYQCPGPSSVVIIVCKSNHIPVIPWTSTTSGIPFTTSSTTAWITTTMPTSTTTFTTTFTYPPTTTTMTTTITTTFTTTMTTTFTTTTTTILTTTTEVTVGPLSTQVTVLNRLQDLRLKAKREKESIKPYKSHSHLEDILIAKSGGKSPNKLPASKGSKNTTEMHAVSKHLRIPPNPPNPQISSNNTTNLTSLNSTGYVPDVNDIFKIIPDFLSKPVGFITNKGSILESGDDLKPKQHLIPLLNQKSNNATMSFKVVNDQEYKNYQKDVLKKLGHDFDIEYDDVLPLILPNPSFEKAKTAFPEINKKPFGRIYPEGAVNEEDKPLEKGLHFLPDLHKDNVVLNRIVTTKEWMDMIKKMGISTAEPEIQNVTKVVEPR